MALKLKVITPNGTFMDDIEIEKANIQTVAGDMTVYQNHSPIISTLRVGVLKVYTKDKIIYVHVHRGLLKVDKDQIKIITQRLYLVDENNNKIDTPIKID